MTTTSLPGAPESVWLERYRECYRTNGYAHAPWYLYMQFLKLFEAPGSVLEIACGNGLLLRYVKDVSGVALEAYGEDINGEAIREAQRLTFPECPEHFVQADLREGIPFPRTFDTVLANPLYADQGYYEQVGGKIQRLHLDGSIEAFIARCWQAVAAGGRLILWCYDGHVREIDPFADGFAKALEKTGIKLTRQDSGPAVFWISEWRAL